MCSRPSLANSVVAVGVAEVELAQPRLEVLIALGDLVEFVLHGGRELVVDEVGEVVLEEVHDGEGAKGRHEGLALLPDVAAPVDRLHHRRVGRRTSDAEVLELLDQRRLGVAVRRLRVVALGLGARHRDDLALGRVAARCAPGRPARPRGRRSLDVGPPKSRELDAQSGRAESDRARRRQSPRRRAASPRVGPCPGSVARRPSGRPACASRSSRRPRVRRRRAGTAPHRAIGRTRRPGESPRAPPGRSSPCGRSAAGRRPRSRRRTSTPRSCARRGSPHQRASSSRCACR